MENMKVREAEAQSVAEETERTLKEKLDKKEYAVQMCELKIVQYEKYLKKRA